MSRKLVLTILISSLFMTWLISHNTAFQHFSNSLSSISQDELMVFSVFRWSEEEKLMKVLENFTEKTGIPVNHTGCGPELQSIVETEFQEHISSADVIIAPWAPWILSLAFRGHLIETTNLINASKYPTRMIASVTNGEGKIWAAPFQAGGKPGFWYKKSFFEDNGLSVPGTYEDFKVLLENITGIAGIESAVASGDTVGWPLSDVTEAFIMGLGGYQLQEDLIAGPTVQNWTDPEVEDVFGNLTELLAHNTVGDDYFSDPAEWTSQITKFWNETYGIYFMGSWMTTMEQIGNVTDLDFFGFPETDGVGGAVDYLVIPKYTPHANESKQLFEWLAGAEAQEIMVGLGGFFGTHEDVPDSAYTPLDKTVLDFISQSTIHIVPDLDDAIGGKFQTTFWAQLRLLWVDPTPETMDDVLQALEDQALAQET